MNSSQEKLLEIARSLIGILYKYAAKPEDIPKYLDCSSFTQYVYKQIGVEIPRSTLLQAVQVGTEIELTTKLEAGDLLFFRGSKGHYDDELFPKKEIYIGHAAIYSSDRKAIHASSSNGVTEEPIDKIMKTRGPIVLIKRMI